MANLAIHKLRLPDSLNNWKDEKITFSLSANELLGRIVPSERQLILCGLSSKDDLMEIIYFFQKKKQYLNSISCSIVLLDFEKGGGLLEAAKRLSFDKIMSIKAYLKNEESSISLLIKEMNEADGKINHKTLEELFSGGNKLVLKENTKQRLYPSEQVISNKSKTINEVITETPVVTFRLYAGESVIESVFNDYFDREVFVTTKILPADRELTLEFKFSYQDNKKGLRLRTDVVNIEEVDGEYQLTLKVESHLVEFETMLKIYKEREQNINTFMKKVRGY